MMYLTNLHRRMMRALRAGGLTMPVLADLLDEPTFRIRGELLGLRRQRLVSDRFQDEGIVWTLTDTAWRWLNHEDQLEFRDAGWPGL